MMVRVLSSRTSSVLCRRAVKLFASCCDITLIQIGILEAIQFIDLKFYLFLLLSESSLCLSSASSSCNSCSASRWVFSSLSRTPSGLRCRMGPERLMERLVQRLRDGEPTSIGPGIDRFSVERLAKKWRTSTGLKILGELHGEACNKFCGCRE
jgi:hypothetical protein